MKPLGKRAKATEFPPLAVMDIETRDWNKVLIICHLDEYGNERSFKTPRRYMQWVFREFEGSRIWAHFGSGFDHRFMLESLIEWEGTSIKAIMSGSLPAIITVENERYKIGEGDDRKNKRITLLDSYRYMPTSLEKIGKSMGEEKQDDVDRSRLHLLSRKELQEYCMQDCRVLLRGLQGFRDTVVNVGGVFAQTGASIAANLVRADSSLDFEPFFENGDKRVYSGTYYAEHRAGSKPGMLQADEYSEPAFYGGRCEVFKRGKFKGPLYYYDINSAYPWAMTQPLPWHFDKLKDGANPHASAEMLERMSSTVEKEKRQLETILKSCGICDAYVTIPKGLDLYPTLPTRAPWGGVVYSEGQYLGRWTCVELLDLYKRGRGRGVKIAVTGWAKFKAAPFARDQVLKLWALRKKAKAEGDEGTSMVLKILMNSMYGKLTQTQEQSSFVTGPAYEFDIGNARTRGELYETNTPGLFEIIEEGNGPYRHIAAGCYVTALARLKLLEGIREAVSAGAQIYYCDTDSIVIDRFMPGWGGSELGEWDLEHTFDEAEFVASKLYRARTLAKPGKPSIQILKAKGANIKSMLPTSSPKALHDKEELLRWLVYAANVSPDAKTELATYQLTTEQLHYYTEKESGLLGFRSSIRAGSMGTLVATLNRVAREPDKKRVHLQDLLRSDPLYRQGKGEGSHSYLDIRSLDFESLLEIELARDAKM